MQEILNSSLASPVKQIQIAVAKKDLPLSLPARSELNVQEGAVLGPLFVSKGGIHFPEVCFVMSKGTGTSSLGNQKTLKRKRLRASPEASFSVHDVQVLSPWEVAMPFSLGSDSEPITLQPAVALGHGLATSRDAGGNIAGGGGQVI